MNNVCLHNYDLEQWILATQRSEAIPYTHPIEVGFFTTALADGVLYVITGGGDATIRTWKYNQAKSTFEHLVLLEGHVRGITALIVCGRFLLIIVVITTVTIAKVVTIYSSNCLLILYYS